MILIECEKCHSLEWKISKFRPKDFPPRYYLTECQRCKSPIGLFNLTNVSDMFMRRDGMTKENAYNLINDLIEI